MKTLEEILTYKNPYAINRFVAIHPISREKAEVIFEDVLRFMWLTETMAIYRKEDPEVPDISISESMYIIDEMWHEFILLTEMYMKFCEEYFEKYVHHPPALDKAIRNTPGMGKEKALEIFVTELVPTVYEYLGEEVTVRWFDEYRQYVPDNFAALIAHHSD